MTDWIDELDRAVTAAKDSNKEPGRLPHYKQIELWDVVERITIEHIRELVDAALYRRGVERKDMEDDVKRAAKNRELGT